MADGIVVTQEQMYALLIRIDATVGQLLATVDSIDLRFAGVSLDPLPDVLGQRPRGPRRL